jgi:thiosulfate dehydrogenase [quinone] large subunit
VHTTLDLRHRSLRILFAALLAFVVVRLGFTSDALATVEAIGASVIGLAALASGVTGRTISVAGLDQPYALGFLTARLFVGWQFLHAGWEKLVTEPGWLGSGHGASAKGFLTGAAAPANSTGAHPTVPAWFADVTHHVFLPHAEVMAYFIVLGELAVGLGLIVGLLTRTAAFFALTLNLAFLFAGSTGGGISPLMVVAELLLITGAVASVRGLSLDLVVARLRPAAVSAADALHVPKAWRPAQRA